MNIWTGEVPGTTRKNSPPSSILESSTKPASNTRTVSLDYRVVLNKVCWTNYTTPTSWGLTNPLEIAIDKVPFDENRVLIRIKPIVVPVIKSENGDFIAEFEDLDMSLWEESVQYLDDAFGAMLRMMWKRYVMGNPQQMTPGALEFRNKLSATYNLV